MDFVRRSSSKLHSDAKALVFVDRRNDAERFKREVPEVAFYHAGLSDKERREQLESFAGAGDWPVRCARASNSGYPAG